MRNICGKKNDKKKRHIGTALLPLCVLTLLSSCGTWGAGKSKSLLDETPAREETQVTEETRTKEELWDAAVEDAVFSENDEIEALVSLTKEDDRVIWDDAGERVLVVTWNDYEEDCSPGNSISAEQGEIWVTSLGEMQQWFLANSSGVEDWKLRFSQLLGVPADGDYSQFTAFWIEPEYLIRPAYVTDVTADMINDYEAVTDPEYKEWFDQNIINSYFDGEYPWTRLGYTYDWCEGGTDYGLTEFLTFDGSKGEIEITLSTEDFVDWLGSQGS